MKTTNPVLNERIFKRETRSYNINNVMTQDGAIDKTFIFGAVLVFVAAMTWKFSSNPLNEVFIFPIVIIGIILGLISAITTYFKPEWAMYTGVIYVVSQGAVIGIVSKIFNSLYKGIVVQAVLLTLGVLFLMLFIYKTKIIEVNNKLRMGVAIAVGAIMLLYLVAWILTLFGIPLMSTMMGSGPWGIGFSLLVVGIAAFSLLLDFDFIDQGVNMKLPKYMEWYAAFGLMVTLIWLYLEILRLLSKIRGDD